MDPALERFVDFLDRHRIRATYAAVAGAAGCSTRSMGALLGERCWRASWVVSAATGEPTDYGAHQKHPDLHLNDEIITTSDELIHRMKREF